MATGRFSDYQVHAWLDDLGTCYAGLHFDNPDTAGAYASEVFGGAYVRQKLLMGSPANRAVFNTNVLAFTGLPACKLMFLGIWDAVYNGNFICAMPVPGVTSDPRTGIRVLPGGRYDVGIEQIALSLSS